MLGVGYGGMNRLRSMETYTLFTVCLRDFKLVLCDNLEGWDGMGGGRKVQEAVDICVPMVDSY